MHGDYRLENALDTGKDFVIVGFGRAAERVPGIRRVKRSPLADVASMWRSFERAARSALREGAPGVRPEDVSRLLPWGTFWSRSVGGAFLRSYLATAGSAAFLPGGREERVQLLELYTLEAALTEIAEKLGRGGVGAESPLRAILDLLDREPRLPAPGADPEAPQ